VIIVPPAGRRLVCLTAALLLVPGSPARAGAPAQPDDVFSLVQEQTVTAVNKRPLPLSETPSSVTVIPEAEIRAMGYHTIGEALRWVRGVFVTYDRNYTYVGVRGLQRPGDYNNKVLLTLDGHTLNGPVYDDALFGNELGIDLEEVERIEVVRGPGSALYGSDAALAVVNIVSRRPRSELGPRVALRTGSGDERRGRVALASDRPGRPEWRAGLSWLQSRGADLFFPEFAGPSTFSGRAIGLDGERALAFLGSAEWGDARLNVKLNEREKTVPTAAFGTRFGDDRNRTWDGRDFVELSASRRPSPTLDLTGRAYWTGSRYHGDFVYDYESAPAPVVNKDRGDADVLGTEWRAHWAAAPRQALTLGFEGQRATEIHLENYDLDPYAPVYDWHGSQGLAAFYVENELRAGEALVATVGARVDKDSRYAAVLSPRADLVWTLAPGTRLKLSGGSAFRAPSTYEELHATLVGTAVGPALLPERLATVEGTLERAAGPVLTLLTVYDTGLRDLIDLTAVDSIGNESYANRARARSQGIEGGVRFTPNAGTHARVSVAWQRSEDGDTGEELTNSPRWNAQLLAMHSPRGAGASMGVGLRYLSSRLTLTGTRTAAALVCDGRIGRTWATGLTAALEVRNLFDARYGDPASREHVQAQIVQDPRTVYVTLTFDGPLAR
jgi:iron complex outermembrane receptor protein